VLNATLLPKLKVLSPQDKKELHRTGDKSVSFFSNVKNAAKLNIPGAQGARRLCPGSENGTRA